MIAVSMANKISHNIKIMSDCLLLLTSMNLLGNATPSEQLLKHIEYRTFTSPYSKGLRIERNLVAGSIALYADKYTAPCDNAG
jgi:hypothetical protein